MAGNTVAAIEAIEQSGQSLNLQNTMDPSGYSAQQAEVTDRAMESAFSNALRLPGMIRNEEVSGGSMTNGSSGIVGDEKSKIVSDLNAPHSGTDGAGANTVEAQMDGMTNRISSLYMEMTNWQVAWSIATRTQQDTNHLLRGS
ncbi:MAG: hypothetical protein ABJM43_19805 [Paracoccaceae bacterium]